MAVPKFVARCETCREYIFDPEACRSFRIRVVGTPVNVLESVDLKGRNPWSGVRVICLSCLRFFKELSG